MITRCECNGNGNDESIMCVCIRELVYSVNNGESFIGAANKWKRGFDSKFIFFKIRYKTN